MTLKIYLLGVEWSMYNAYIIIQFIYCRQYMLKTKVTNIQYIDIHTFIYSCGCVLIWYDFFVALEKPV